jgi:hypothetical protein
MFYRLGGSAARGSHILKIESDLVINTSQIKEPVISNVYGAQESIPRNKFRQHI